MIFNYKHTILFYKCILAQQKYIKCNTHYPYSNRCNNFGHIPWIFDSNCNYIIFNNRALLCNKGDYYINTIYNFSLCNNNLFAARHNPLNAVLPNCYRTFI